MEKTENRELVESLILAEWNKVKDLKYENTESLYVVRNVIMAIKQIFESRDRIHQKYYSAFETYIKNVIDYRSNAGDAAKKKLYNKYKNKIHGDLFSLRYVNTIPPKWE